MKTTAKYAWSFSRNSSFLRGLFYYAPPCRPIARKLVKVTFSFPQVVQKHQLGKVGN